VIFATRFCAALCLSIMPPYQTYITYKIYIVPGLCGMVQLLNRMQFSLSLVYDRAMGTMRLLLTSSLPRSWLLFCKVLASVCVSILQVYAFLIIAVLADIQFPLIGYAQVFPALIATGLMLGSIGLLLSSTVKQLQNFSRVMKFVIFPVFFYQPHFIHCGKWQKRPFCCTIYAPIIRFLMPLSGFALRFMVKRTLLQQFG
jgi:ABC-2 type transport system permease protein